MKIVIRCFLLFIGLGSCQAIPASPLTFSSPVEQVTLIELYTSEGCSSCPPADRWLSRLKSDPQLWQSLVPLAFHVDYWDYLGWRDRFSDAQFSQRQRRYARKGYVSTVYTPGMFKNGREWRRWYSQRTVNAPAQNRVGVLAATIEKGRIAASFDPVVSMDQPIVLNIALLGFDLSTQVPAGENRGKNLQHDFVVLTWKRTQSKNAPYTWTVETNKLNNLSQAKGIAFWLSKPDDPTPIQATGGWLTKN